MSGLRRHILDYHIQSFPLRSFQTSSTRPQGVREKRWRRGKARRIGFASKPGKTWAEVKLNSTVKVKRESLKIPKLSLSTSQNLNLQTFLYIITRAYQLWWSQWSNKRPTNKSMASDWQDHSIKRRADLRYGWTLRFRCAWRWVKRRINLHLS